MIRDPAFWWREDGTPLAARLLTPLASAYGAITARLMERRGARAAVPVICVGNLTVGGAGKTPTAIALAAALKAARKPVFLSRGYGGSLPGPLLVGAHTAREVGDEPLLLARHAPAIVSHDRVAGAATAVTAGADVIVMDDGLQNPSLMKDFALAVVDGARGVGNGCVFPAGPLRAAIDRQFAHVDAMLVVGAPGASARRVAEKAGHAGIPVFRGVLAPSPEALAALAGRRILAFAGIGHPDKFFAMLRAHGLAPEYMREFADHRPYTAQDAAGLLAAARRDGLTLVTTEKDAARMAGEDALADLAAAVTTMPVTLVLDDEPELMRLISARLDRRGAAASSPRPG